MPNPFVYIVESPSPSDLLDGRTEGGTLKAALQLSGVDNEYRLAVDMDTFYTALGQLLVGEVKKRGNAPAIIHISAHGLADGSGIALTDGTKLSWDALRPLFVAWNASFNGNLVLCLSTCYGARGCAMAMDETSPLPFRSVIGHWGKAAWDAAAVAFVVFYHRLFNGAPEQEAVAAMVAASGDSQFSLLSAQKIQDVWIKKLQEASLNPVMMALRAGTAPVFASTTTEGTQP